MSATVPLGFDCVVIGAGVVGLAIARAMALAGRHTVLLEAASSFGTGISSRNSEVIHAGIYYAPDSLKAKLCVAGNRALYAYCREKSVPAQRMGKLIVAVDEAEVHSLHAYQQRALASGVTDLAWLTKAQVQQLEPEVCAVAGLFSPSTGIIDSHALMSALLFDFEQAGGIYVANSPVERGRIKSDAILLEVGGAEPCSVIAAQVINAAGMGAQKVAASIAAFPQQQVPGLYYAVGHYFALQGRSPFRHLVYPVAVAGGLGVHLTLDLAGQPRFGPDISWRDSDDYHFDESREQAFYQAIRRYWPHLRDGALMPAYTGIRPKLYGPACPDQDFMISGPSQHGVAGLINLFGIESPGLTASLALADYLLAIN